MTEAPAAFTADGYTWLTVPEAARRLGVTTGRIYHIVWDHRLILHPKPPHGRTYVRADSVEDYRRYRDQLVKLQTTRRALDPAGR